MMKILLQTLILFVISGTAHSQSKNYGIDESNKLGRACYFRGVVMKSDTLQSKLIKYLKGIEPYELPILSIDTKGDTTRVYLSAVIAANAIRNSPPSYVTKIGGRGVAVYTGSESVMSLDSICLNRLVEDCRRFLHIDVVNNGEGRSPGAVTYYTHDPIWVKITLLRNNIISINDKGQASRSLPFFKFSF